MLREARCQASSDSLTWSDGMAQTYIYKNINMYIPIFYGTYRVKSTHELCPPGGVSVILKLPLCFSQACLDSFLFTRFSFFIYSHLKSSSHRKTFATLKIFFHFYFWKYNFCLNTSKLFSLFTEWLVYWQLWSAA